MMLGRASCGALVRCVAPGVPRHSGARASAGQAHTGQHLRAELWAEKRRHRNTEGIGLKANWAESGQRPALRHPEQREAIREVRRLGKGGHWQEALSVLDAVHAPCASLSIAAMNACARSLKMEQVEGLFAGLEEKTIPAYNVLISTRGLRDPANAELLLGEMRDRDLHPDSGVFRSVIDAYGRAHRMVDAMRVFQEMGEAGVGATVVTYQTVISACARAGQRDRAVELLERMEADGLAPDVGHFTSVIVSCIADKAETQARAILEKMRQRGIEPDTITYTALMKCFSGEGALAEAEQLLAEMRQRSVPTDVYLYNSLLGAAVESRNPGRFREILADMEASGLRGNTDTTLRIRDMDDIERVSTPQRALPDGWHEAVDPASGRPYFWQGANPAESVTWERPV